MASGKSEIRLPSASSPSEIEATPGAYPPTPEPDSPVLVSSQLCLSQAVYKRRAEYTVQRSIRIKIGTWNVAALSGPEKDLKGWFVDGKGISEHLSGLPLESQGEFAEQSKGMESVEDQEERRSKRKPTVPENDPGAIPGGETIELYILGLQEIVDVTSAKHALRPYNDPIPAGRWKQAVTEALPSGYHLVAEQQLIGLYLLIYASPAILPTISNVSTTNVGTGALGYMGNKGGVTARFILGETTRVVFVNCHLAAGVENGNLERRNWDAAQILNKTRFDPVIEDGRINDAHHEAIGEEDFAFWFGDLNYRLEGLPGEDVRRLLMLHTKGEYGQDRASLPKIVDELESSQATDSESADEGSSQTIKDDITSISEISERSSDKSTSSPTTSPELKGFDPSSDPASLQATLSPLLTHDQLHAQMRQQRAFHNGWREGNITFLPTYKYDVGSVGMFDSSEKRRGPSWCDRILFRTRQDKLNYDEQVKDKEQSKRRDDEMKLRGVVEAATNEAVLFDYDPETDGAENEQEETCATSKNVPTKAGVSDRLFLEYYTSHQRVLSSDHKPLDAVFTIDYDAIDPKLKAQVHQEVARELDKAENEGRPVVTVVVDRPRDVANRPNQATDSDVVDFGDVKYDRIKHRSITIANTGRVPATVGFVDRSVEPGQRGGVAPPWVSIRFNRVSDNENPDPSALREYTIEPGDAANVELTLHVTDLALVSRLNANVETLDDVLVLRILAGRDYFLPLHAKWLQSAFGRSIEKLIKLPEGGVRKLQQQHPEGSGESSDAVKWSAPRELFRLTGGIEKLVERAVGEWEMRAGKTEAPWEKNAGWPFDRSSKGEQHIKLKGIVREALDCDRPFEEYWPAEASSIQQLEALAETLLDFLNSLQDGILTDHLWTELETGLIDQERAKKMLPKEEEQSSILEILSAAPPHSVSFTFLTFMLTNVVNEIALALRPEMSTSPSSTTSSSKESSNQIGGLAARQKVVSAYASIFAESMIRLPKDSKGKARRANEGRRKHVLEVFLPSLDDDCS